MTDTLFLIVANYGAAALFVATFLSCLAVPVPSSLMMVTGGAFAAAGDLMFASAAGAAAVGAIAGDQLGYRLGRSGAPVLNRWAARRRARAVLLARSRVAIQQWGGTAVFLSRWLVSPLGPYVNFASGAGQMQWLRFTLWSVAGELVWVVAYMGMGYVFASNLEAVAEIAADISGLLAGLAVTILLGLLLLSFQRRRGRTAWPSGRRRGEWR